jgi:hypothetical protein
MEFRHYCREGVDGTEIAAYPVFDALFDRRTEESFYAG